MGSDICNLTLVSDKEKRLFSIDRKLMSANLRLLVYLKNRYLSAYLSVLRVCSLEPELGEMQEIITVLEFPTKESLNTSVNLLPLKGI